MAMPAILRRIAGDKGGNLPAPVRQLAVSRAPYDGRMSVLRTIVRGTLLALLAMAAAWAVEVFARQFS
jgi:hypothetical protein